MSLVVDACLCEDAVRFFGTLDGHDCYRHIATLALEVGLLPTLDTNIYLSRVISRRLRFTQCIWC